MEKIELGTPERYQFTWPGKREAKAEARRPIYKTMIPEPSKSKDWDTTEARSEIKFPTPVSPVISAPSPVSLLRFLMKNPCNALACSHDFWYHSTGCATDGAIGNKCDDTRRRCICAPRSLATATLQSYRMQLFRIRRSECTQS